VKPYGADKQALYIPAGDIDTAVPTVACGLPLVDQLQRISPLAAAHTDQSNEGTSS